MREFEKIFLPNYEGYPKYTKNSMTDRVGVGIMMKTLAKINFFFKELPTGDVGVDGIIEPVIGEYGTGQLIACQIKSSETRFCKRPKQRVLNFNGGNYSHYKYWVNKSIPVIVILVDTTNEVCYWEHISDDNIKKNKKTFSISVSTKNIIDEKAAGELFEISLNRNVEDAKYFHLRQAKDLLYVVRDEVVQVNFKIISPGEAEIDQYIGNIYVDTGFFNYESSVPIYDAIKQYFFWANIGKFNVRANGLSIILDLNCVGKKFIQLNEQLKKVNLEFK